MMNTKIIYSALMAVLYMTVMPVAYAAHPVEAPAEASANDLQAPYRCAGMAEPLQRVYVNLGQSRGFVPLDISVTHSQPISISALKQCLLQNGLMSKQEFSVYSKAVEVCRSAHAQKKAQFSRGSMATNISTSKAFNFDHCLQDNLLD